MKKNSIFKFERALQVLMILSIIIIILLGPLYIFAFNKSYFLKQLEKNTDSTISYEEKVSLTNNVIDYLKGNTELSTKFNEREKKHMQDVKNIFDVSRLLFIISLATILLSFGFYYNKDKLKMIKPIFIGSIVSGIFLFFIAISSIFSFVYSFEVFHNIFFKEGTWLFYTDDLLIILFPETFFSNISVNIFITGFILSLLIAITAFFTIKEKKTKK